MNGNGHKENEERKKKCPFLGEWCIGQNCALYAEVVKNVNGLMMKSGMCGFVSLGVLLSEINQKTQPPQPPRQQIQLPNLRG